jgi:hypothetical protein
MRWLLLAALLPLNAWGQYSLYACLRNTREYVVGAKLPPSGLFVKSEGEWRHVGFNHPFVSAIDGPFLAAGNGLIRATALGWKILTGSDVTELMDVAVDPNAPGTIYFTHTRGIQVSHDLGATWTSASEGLHRKYTQAIRVDRTHAGVLIAGNEEGVFRSPDGGKTWKLAGAAGWQVLRVEQSPHDACFWLASTQGGGLYRSSDCGVTFESNGDIGVGRNINDIAFDPTTRGRIAVAGFGIGVAVSEDRGKTWRASDLPTPQAWSVVFDPAHAGRLYAGLQEKGVFVSDDAGHTWKLDGLEGTEVYRMRFAGPLPELYRQTRGPSAPAAPVRSAPPLSPRGRTVVEAYAHPKGPPGYANIAAKLRLHEDAATSSEALQKLLAAPTGDMFWMYPVTAIAYLDQGQLTPAARRALRDSFRTYMPYRGDTENHWLLYYTSVYLISQLWPDLEWYNGKSSAENLREAGGWIESWVRLTTRRGQGEYDSPHYMGLFYLSMSYLAAWANDPAMQKRAAMMLDYLTADFAPEILDDGVFAGAHSRLYDAPVLEKWQNPSSDFAWLLFGIGHPADPPGNYAFFTAVASDYQPPAILQRIAHDRSAPYTHYELKRTRNRWRFYDDLHGPVYKTAYVRREYAVGSDQGGTLQPIQEHSWDVTWNVPDPRGVQNTLFTVNPHSSLRELQTYFTFPADYAVAEVVSSKKSYDSPDKFVGGSPYEQIFQDHDAVIVLYGIPPGSRFPHINGFFSKDLAEVREDPSGWIFAHGGDALIACRPLQPYSWRPIDGGGRRLFSPYLHNGMVMQVAARSEFAGLDAFARAILALPLEFRLDPAPSVRFRSLRGKLMTFTYGERPQVDGVPLDYEHWPLFGGPFVEAAVDSETLTLKYGGMRRTLDFRNLTVTDAR